MLRLFAVSFVSYNVRFRSYFQLWSLRSALGCRAKLTSSSSSRESQAQSLKRELLRSDLDFKAIITWHKLLHKSHFTPRISLRHIFFFFFFSTNLRLHERIFWNVLFCCAVFLIRCNERHTRCSLMLNCLNPQQKLRLSCNRCTANWRTTTMFKVIFRFTN